MTSQQTITVGVSEFDNRTSELLKAVEADVGVEITRREKPIARVTAMNTEPPYGRLNRLGMIRKPRFAIESRFRHP